MAKALLKQAIGCDGRMDINTASFWDIHEPGGRWLGAISEHPQTFRWMLYYRDKSNATGYGTTLAAAWTAAYERLEKDHV